MSFPSEVDRLQEYRDGFSDLHKDVYGFRPRHSTLHLTVEQWEVVYRDLYLQLNQNLEIERKNEAAAVEKFEADVKKLIEMGAADRETAIRWISEAENAGGDLDYLAFLRGLPYRFFHRPTPVTDPLLLEIIETT